MVLLHFESFKTKDHGFSFPHFQWFLAELYGKLASLLFLKKGKLQQWFGQVQTAGQPGTNAEHSQF